MSRPRPDGSETSRPDPLSTLRLDRRAETPIFAQIRDHLHQAIADGTLAPRQRLPSEARLAEQLSVSRMTVRQALDALVADGFLYRLPANGTFVAERRIDQPMSRVSSFTEELTARGMRPSSAVLSQAFVAASLEMAQLFRLPPGFRLFQLTRLRLADDEPLAIERCHIPSMYAPGLERHDFSRESLYEVLRREHGLELASAHQTIGAALPSAAERSTLGITRLTPVLRIHRFTADEGGRVVEWVDSTYRSDRYQLSVELR